MAVPGLAQLPLADLRALFGTLKKYDSAFTAEAKQQLQASTSLVEHVEAELASFPNAGGVSGYLACGSKQMSLRPLVQQLQQAVSGIANGVIPIPRSSKEELSRLHGLVLNAKVPLPPLEQQQLVLQLRKLCVDFHAQAQDNDVIETQLDGIMRRALAEVHGAEPLGEQALAAEVSGLEAGLAQMQAAKAQPETQMLALALNSLQRLHAGSQAPRGEDDDDDEESEEPASTAGGVDGLGDDDDDDDDDDDPFFMPMPGAIKWAEASRFKMLAAPLAPEQPADKQFMIVVDQDEEESPSGVSAGPGTPSDPVSTSSPSDPTPPAAAAAAAAAAAEQQQGMEALSLGAGAGAGAAATAPGVEAASSAGGQQATAAAGPAEPGGLPPPLEPVATVQPPLLPAAASAAAGTAAGAAAGTPAAAAVGQSAALGTTTSQEPAPPEKLAQFVDFLNGENPGSCMFHAQMRLSPEGCQKLANFLRSSARVRALSLSHNYLGDAGLAIICGGLRSNKSVTALDLPDNAITDKGMVVLVEAIANNPSLTQLQLAYNKIGDEGAAALAGYIKNSQSLKKLGLSYNAIGKAGCRALTAAINSNQSLKHLQLLPGNPVEEKDAKALAKALKRNNKFSIRSLLGLKDE